MQKLILSVLLGIAVFSATLQGASPDRLKPYKTLLVVGTWADETSQVVTAADTFQPVAALLKAWSIPFDILRLDQQNLGPAYLFERSGEVRYGLVLWLADLSSYRGNNLNVLKEAVQGGTSVVAVASRLKDPVLADIFGLRYKADFRADAPLLVSSPHFITRELGENLTPSDDFGSHIWLEPAGAQTLIHQGVHPALTVYEPSPTSSAIWIAAPDLCSLRDSNYWRSLFQRSLTWAFGYLVVPDFDYSREILVMIDDWGTSDKSYLSYWKYQSLPESTMLKDVIPVFQKHHVTASANVITGFVDRKTHRILSPWTQKFTDDSGVVQDYASTRRGLLDAVKAGVIEIESHGWTHMQDDLDSAPGPWWNADLQGEASVGGWYEEFEDSRRGVESPALIQLYHLQRSIEYLKEDFDARPLSVIIGGGGWSRSYPNQSARIAAKAGFGLFDINESYFYLDQTLTLDMTGISPGATHQYDRQLKPSEWPRHPDGPYVLLFHDRDISLQPDFVERTFNAVPNNAAFVTMNQYIGVLHAGISCQSDAMTLAFDYDEHYCAYFRNHGSSWRLMLSDPLQNSLRQSATKTLSIDGQSVNISPSDLDRRQIVIHLQPGLGTHKVTLPLN